MVDKLLLVLTKNCNRKCRFCIDAPNRKYYPETLQFMSLETVQKVLQFAKEKQVRTIALNGGEPTLHPQIVTIAKLIKAQGFQLKLFTNYDFPDIVKQLDGIVDIIRISYYGPNTNLPKQKDFKSKLTLKITLSQDTFPKLEQLVKFVNEQRQNFSDLKIHTLMQNNDYSIGHQVDYLDLLTQKYPLKRNQKGDYYHDFMGLQIEREDLPNLDYQTTQRLYKAHMDGTISHYFEEDHHQLNHLDQNASLTKALRAHRNTKYRHNVLQAHQNAQLDLQNLDQYLPHC